MKGEELSRIARKIVSDNNYLTLGTIGKEPWVAPLYYATDPNFNFYYISQMDSRHTQHVLKIPM